MSKLLTAVYRRRRHSGTLWLLCLLIVPAAPAHAGEQRLRLEIPDTTIVYVPGLSTGSTLKLPVYFDNYLDTIAGFQIWLQLDRPDVLAFQTGTDTVVEKFYWICTAWSGDACLDSILTNDTLNYDWFTLDSYIVQAASIDTTGTLISEWEYVTSRSLSSVGYDALITGLADLAAPPITAGIAPQTGGILVYPLLMELSLPARSAPATSASVLIQRQFIEHFSFSDPNGNLVGVVTDTAIDTSYYICTQWMGDSCLNWRRVSLPPYDSMALDTDYVLVFDSTACTVIDGSVTLVMCADANGDGAISVADLTLLISYLFGGCGANCPLYRPAADLDGSGSVQISDLTALILYLFRGDLPPVCGLLSP